MKIIRVLWETIVLLCIGTVLAQCAMLGVLWNKGWMAPDRLHAALSGFYGLPQINSGLADEAKPADSEQSSYQMVAEQRLMAQLDLGLREDAIEKGLGELRVLETRIKTERQRFDYLQDSFDQRLSSLQANATDGAIQEIQRTLENMPPKQAKEQVLKMLSETAKRGEARPIESVVAVVKAMSLDKRKKLLQEFKSEAEMNFLADILREIREGSPDLPILKEAREKLDRLKPSTNP